MGDNARMSQQPMGMMGSQQQMQYAGMPPQMPYSQAPSGGQSSPGPPGQQMNQPGAMAAVPYVGQGMAMQQYQHLQQQHQQQLQLFWQQQMQEIEQVNDFKNSQLPLARIKKIMKADEDVRMISAEAPVLFSKACEMFILELTLRSWIHTEENKRRTLQKNDIAGAITRTDIFDFLVDIVPRDELKEEGLGVPRPMGMPTADQMQYGGMYYVPQQPPMQMDPAAMYGQQRPMYMQPPMQGYYPQPPMQPPPSGIPPPS
eukprot:TRINITY_DN447_c0_g1_i1.p1 TRINITY_DN447_c0_g1~~TRINITY_DN447_c0_g1_i1.p1  ORF type:complete len:258 (+),score=67.08 TRINITY_DN447_c0_g1_i1:391-1164(+)